MSEFIPEILTLANNAASQIDDIIPNDLESENKYCEPLLTESKTLRAIDKSIQTIDQEWNTNLSELSDYCQDIFEAVEEIKALGTVEVTDNSWCEKLSADVFINIKKQMEISKKYYEENYWNYIKARKLKELDNNDERVQKYYRTQYERMCSYCAKSTLSFTEKLQIYYEFDKCVVLFGTACAMGDVNLENINEWFAMYVASFVDDSNVVWFMDMMSGSIPECDIEDHYKTNVEIWNRANTQEVICSKDGYIENQSGLRNCESNGISMQYGRNNDTLSGIVLNDSNRKLCAADNSCEVIATYNALHYLNDGRYVEKYDFPELISSFERDGITMGGYFGTSPVSIKNYFDSEGYKTAMYQNNSIENNFSQLEKGYDTYILTIINNENNISNEVHTMCITKENGKYIVHNDFSNGDAEGADNDKNVGWTQYESLQDVVDGYNQGNGNLISIIEV